MAYHEGREKSTTTLFPLVCIYTLFYFLSLTLRLRTFNVAADSPQPHIDSFPYSSICTCLHERCIGVQIKRASWENTRAIYEGAPDGYTGDIGVEMKGFVCLILFCVYQWSY